MLGEAQFPRHHSLCDGDVSVTPGSPGCQTDYSELFSGLYAMGPSIKRRPRPTGLNKDGICGDGGPVSLRAGGFGATDYRSAGPFVAAQYHCAMRGNISTTRRTEWSWRPAWASRIAMPQSLRFVWAGREAFAACLEYAQTGVLGALKWWWPAALALLSIGLFSFFFCFLPFVAVRLSNTASGCSTRATSRQHLQHPWHCAFPRLNACVLDTMPP